MVPGGKETSAGTVGRERQSRLDETQSEKEFGGLQTQISGNLVKNIAGEDKAESSR